MGLETFLRRWWVAKYKLPWTHECAQNATLEDLLVEFYEDRFEKHPEEARKVLAVDGEFSFEDLDDPLLAKWEAELAKGVTPDLEEGLSIAERQKLERERARAKQARQGARQLGEVTDNYADPMFQSKYAAVGSPEEAALLKSKTLGHGDVIEDLYNKLIR